MNQSAYYQKPRRGILSRTVRLSFKFILLMLAALYWVSPIDLLPGIPLDDIAVMFTAIWTALKK